MKSLYSRSMLKLTKIPMNDKSQIDKFRETARALETDESEANFDRNLKKIAKSNPAKKPSKVKK